MSTGEFYLYQVDNVRDVLKDELARIAPKEILTNAKEDLLIIDSSLERRISVRPQEVFSYPAACKALRAHFGQSVREMGLEEKKLGVSAAGALIQYLSETQKNALEHILSIRAYESCRTLSIDRLALANLELIKPLRGGGRRGSLLFVLDHTRTAMGSRLLRSWIERPLCDSEEIHKRLDAVEGFLQNFPDASALREALSGVYDIERLMSKIAYDTVNAQ